MAGAFKNRRRLAAAAAGLLSPAEVDRLLAHGPPGPPATMSPSVFALLDEARWLIDPELRTFGHVVIDEAQNLTAMELRMIVRRAREQSVTVLGDIAQRTAEAGTERWERVLGDAGVERFALAELLVSYRVPADFLRLAAAVAPDGGARCPRACAPRRGPRSPCATRAGRARRRPARRSPRAWRRRPAASASSSRRAAARSSTRRSPASPPRRRRTRRAGCRRGVDLLGLRAIKGLEFDAAIVVEPAAILAERPDGGRGRPLHGAHALHAGARRRACRATSRPGSRPPRSLRHAAAAGAPDAWSAGRRRTG